jgi:sugar lactone lactonase YvrE
MAKYFTCPSCGAPLVYDGGPELTIICPFCRNSVIVPTEMRSRHPDVQPSILLELDASTITSRLPFFIGLGILVFLLIIIGIIFINVRADSVAFIAPTSTPWPSPTLVPSATPTPEYASLDITLGSEGITPGKFKEANSIAVDQDGFIYVGDYEGNRIQVFDPAGKFITQWNLNPEEHIRHLAVDYSGGIYVNQSGRIYRYDRKTGEQIGQVQYRDEEGDEDDFDTLVVTPDGSLVAAWINHTLEIDNILIIDRSGKVVNIIEKAVSGQTGSVETYIWLAVDGVGNIYALGIINNTIVKYSMQGKFLTRFGSRGDKPGQFDTVDSIAVDSQGMVYVGDAYQVMVFDPTGFYIDTFAIDGIAYDLTFDRSDNLYIIDNKKVMKYTLRDRK